MLITTHMSRFLAAHQRIITSDTVPFTLDVLEKNITLT